MAAARLRHCMVDETYRPVCDLVARASHDLAAGTRLDIVGSRHAVPDIRAGLTEIGAARADNALPYYMAGGRTLKRAVKSGAAITFADVTPPQDSVLWTLRQEQDAAFAAAEAVA